MALNAERSGRTSFSVIGVFRLYLLISYYYGFGMPNSQLQFLFPQQLLLTISLNNSGNRTCPNLWLRMSCPDTSGSPRQSVHGRSSLRWHLYQWGWRLPHSHGVGIEYSPLPGGSRLVSLHSFLLGLQLVPLHSGLLPTVGKAR